MNRADEMQLLASVRPSFCLHFQLQSGRQNLSPEALPVSRASPSLMADIRANPFNYYLYQDCADELGEISTPTMAATPPCLFLPVASGNTHPIFAGCQSFTPASAPAPGPNPIHARGLASES